MLRLVFSEQLSEFRDRDNSNLVNLLHIQQRAIGSNNIIGFYGVGEVEQVVVFQIRRAVKALVK